MSFVVCCARALFVVCCDVSCLLCVGRCSPFVVCRLLVVACWLLFVVFFRLMFGVGCVVALLLVVCDVLCVVCRLSCVVCCLLFAVCGLVFVVWHV